MRIAILDDEKHHIEVTKKIVQDFFGEEEVLITCYETKKDFDNDFEISPFLFDILVLDILLPQSDGIEIAREIRSRNERCRIIFLSNYLEFATEVYETEHTFFVLKSDAVKKLPVAIKKAIDQLEKRRKESICIKALHDTQKVICFEDVVYVERVKRRTIINTVSGEEETLENVSDVFGSLEDKLVRCHRSYWANPAHLKSFSSSELVFVNGMKIPLSRSYSKEMKLKVMNYITSDK
ncbi:MAG: response regulator transcription factor [Ruminococcaceae bacterium]|nr:response regulator transcription factor [Oscillospiraceae bacterium]